jgi:hypothetical protein
VLRHQRQRQQQSGEELAGHIATHLDRLVQLQTAVALQVQWRVTVLPLVGDVTTELSQRVDQVANRALVHAGHAVQTRFRAHQRQGGGQGAHGGARIAHEQIQLSGGCLTAQAGDADRAASFHHCAAHLAQSIEHDAGVVRVQQVMQSGGALAQSREQQHAVGNAFRARQRDRALGALQGGNVEEGGGEHAFNFQFSSPACISQPARTWLALAISSCNACKSLFSMDFSNLLSWA